MKLKVSRDFWDRTLERRVSAGSVIERDEKRADELLRAGVAIAVEDLPDSAPEAKRKTTEKKRA